MKVVRELDEKLWGEFVANHPGGSIFHTPEMFRVFAQAEGYCPDLWAVVAADGRILALLLPVRITVLGKLFLRICTRSVGFGSILCSEEPEGMEALDLLLRAYVRDVSGPPLFTELRNLANLDDYQPVLSKNGFMREDHLNYLVDLGRSPEDILMNIGPRTRKAIRRGLRTARVVVEEVKNLEGVAACYSLLRQSYAGARVPLASPALFEEAFALLQPKGMIRFTLARVDGRPAAASIDLLYKEVMYGWYGGVDRSLGEYTPNELLQWHVLEWGANNGYRQYDFGGAGKPTQEYRVRDYKAKFGGELVNFGRNTFVHAPALLKLSEIGYQLLRRFLSLPGREAEVPYRLEGCVTAQKGYGEEAGMHPPVI